MEALNRAAAEVLGAAPHPLAELVVEIDRDPDESMACRVCGARAGEPCSTNCPARVER